MAKADHAVTAWLHADDLDPATVLRIAGESRAAASSWAELGSERRLSVVARCADILREQADELTADYIADGVSRALGEKYRWHILAIDRPRLTAIARELTRRVVDLEGRDRGEVIVRRPDGVVLVIAPTLAPGVALMGLLEVLLAGNVVISRVAYRHPATKRVADALQRSLSEHSLDLRIFTAIVGSTRTVLHTLGVSKEVDTVVFYGGYEVGCEIFASGSAMGKKVVLELEGNDSIVAWADADVERVVESAAGVFNVSGAACLSPRRVLCHGSVYPEITERLAAAARECRTVATDGLRGVLTPMKSAEYAKVARDLHAANAKVVAGGMFLAEGDVPSDEPSSYMAPMVVTTDSKTFLKERQPTLERELLAPVSATIDCGSTIDDVVEILRRNPFHNRVSVWTHDAGVVRAILHAVPGTGMVLINAAHMGGSLFGGQSGGRGRSGGPWGESILFWQRTTSQQTIRCDGSVEAVLDALGARRLSSAIELY